jgi:hypothetical protein
VTEILCACGHSAGAHEHFRKGSDCGACGREVCARFTPVAQTEQVVTLHEAADPSTRPESATG